MSKVYDIVEFPIIGLKYHVKWAGLDAAFRLIDVGNEYCVIKADSKKKMLVCHKSELLHTVASAKEFDKLKKI